MLVFIDESGDPGFMPGSSRFFTVVLVLFEEEDEAIACDNRIQLLRRELRLPEDYEFKFSHNSHRVKSAFLQAVAPYGFFYTAVSLNKVPEKLWGPGFREPNTSKASLNGKNIAITSPQKSYVYKSGPRKDKAS